MKDAILVTGATGNVGREIVRLLEQKALPVRAAVSDPERATAMFGEGVACTQFRFGEADTYAQAFHDVRAVFLMRPPQIVNVKKNIYPAIDAAQKAGVKHMVFLSLQGVEKNPLVPHHKIEKYLMRSGIRYTFLRPSFFMQNLSTTHRDEIRNDNCIFVPAGAGKTSFVDVRDIAEVAVKVLTETGHENSAYELTGNEALSYDEVAGIFSQVLERPIRYARPSAFHFWQEMRSKGHPAAFVVVMLALYTVARLGWAAKTTDDVTTLLARPPISMRQFIEDHAHIWI